MRFLALVLLTASVLHVSAQAPQAFSFQAVATTAGGAAIADASIGVRISLRSGATDGPVVYRETHTTTTSPRGLFTLAIGRGSVVSGTFASIAWGANRHFVEVEIDPAGGSSYTTLGVQELLSVPYALYAENGGGTGSGSIAGTVITLGSSDFSGTTVLAVRSDGLTLTDLTDSRGTFEIQNAPAGYYVLKMSKSGFDTTKYGFYHGGNGPTLPEYFGLNPDGLRLVKQSTGIVSSFTVFSESITDITFQITLSNSSERPLILVSTLPNPNPNNSYFDDDIFLTQNPSPGIFRLTLPKNTFSLGNRSFSSGQKVYLRAYPSSEFPVPYIDPETLVRFPLGVNLAGASQVLSFTLQ